MSSDDRIYIKPGSTGRALIDDFQKVSTFLREAIIEDKLTRLVFRRICVHGLNIFAVHIDFCSPSVIVLSGNQSDSIGVFKTISKSITALV